MANRLTLTGRRFGNALVRSKPCASLVVDHHIGATSHGTRFICSKFASS